LRTRRARTSTLPTLAIIPPWANFALVLVTLVVIHFVHYRNLLNATLMPEQKNALLAFGIEQDLLVAGVTAALSGLLALTAPGRLLGLLASNLPVWLVVGYSLIDFGFLRYSGRHIDRMQWSYLQPDSIFFLRGTILEQLKQPATFIPLLCVLLVLFFQSLLWRICRRDLLRPRARSALLLGSALVLAIGLAPRLGLSEQKRISSHNTQLDTNAIVHTADEWLDSSATRFKETPDGVSRKQFAELQNAGGSYRQESEQYPFVMVPADPDACPNRGARKNVVLIQLESFSGFSVNPLTPYYKNITPEFEELTKEGVLLERFFINALPTAPAMVSAMCSVPDLRMLMRNPDGRSLSCSSKTFRDAGYRTALIANSDEYYDGRKPFVLANGFDEMIGDLQFQTPASNPKRPGQWGTHHDGELFDEAARWMDEHVGQKPFLLWLITTSSHDPFPDYGEEYETHQGEGKRRSAHRSTRFVDAQLGRFIRELKTRPYYKDTIFILFGDHPTWFASPVNAVAPLMELDNPDRAAAMARTSPQRTSGGSAEVNFTDDLFVNSWVPGLILNPVGLQPGTRISWPTSQMDLMPTALDMAGVCDRRLSAGHSLIDRKIDPKNRYALVGAFHFGQLALVQENLGVATPVSGGTPQFYDLSQFPLPARPLPSDGSPQQKVLVERFELLKRFSYWALDADRLWPLNPPGPISFPAPAVSGTSP
jgi:phosphoglycerol transferase MdoB-like AlkP superfamily enzyme